MAKPTESEYFVNEWSEVVRCLLHIQQYGDPGVSELAREQLSELIVTLPRTIDRPLFQLELACDSQE